MRRSKGRLGSDQGLHCLLTLSSGVVLDCNDSRSLPSFLLQHICDTHCQETGHNALPYLMTVKQRVDCLFCRLQTFIETTETGIVSSNGSVSLDLIIQFVIIAI